MELYIDTCNIQEIQEAISWGVIDGITTNPSLIKKEVERLKTTGQQTDMKTHITKILTIAGEERPVSLEVTGQTAQEMYAQGKKLYQMFNEVAKNVVVKIPIMTTAGKIEGLKAIKALEKEEIPVNCTLIFTPEQALLAAKAGATYVSPFVGRIDDYLRTQAGIEYQKTDYFPKEGWGAETEEGEEDTLDDNGIISGVDLVEKIVEIFSKHEIDCNVLAASIRNPRQVREVAIAESDIATIPYAVIKELLTHPKTDEGIKKFNEDVMEEYQKLFGEVNTAQVRTEEQHNQTTNQQTPFVQPTSTQQNSPAQTNQNREERTEQKPVTQNQNPSAYDLVRR